MSLLKVLTIENSSAIDASIIWLHGLGADGYDFEPVVQALQLPHIRFILPHAPSRPVTLNSGYIMPAWYDILGLSPDSAQDKSGIYATSMQINELIAEEINRGISANRIMLAGFSQGGAIALHCATRYPEKLAGILALSTYLPLKETLATEAHEVNKDTPIFMAHGKYDEVITLDTCLLSLNTLQNQKYHVEWHEYPMAHSVCPEEIADIRHFICAQLAYQP